VILEKKMYLQLQKKVHGFNEHLRAQERHAGISTDSKCTVMPLFCWTDSSYTIQWKVAVMGENHSAVFFRDESLFHYSYVIQTVQVIAELDWII
ncbi:hypothetical protein DKP78_16730, partial [Enterococcus faecium]